MAKKLSEAQERNMRSLRAEINHSRRDLSFEGDREFRMDARSARSLVAAGMVSYVFSHEEEDERARHRVYEWNELVAVKMVVRISDKGVEWVERDPKEKE